MRIGIISEGHADRAVITNILKGLIDINPEDIVALRPSDNFDETDKAVLPPNAFSSWSVVKEECENRESIDKFLLFEDHEFVVIHLDTAEAEEFGIIRPPKNSPNYCSDLRNLIIRQINDWFNDDISDSILHAIAIEEIEAWILPIYEKKISSNSASPKEKLDMVLGKKKINSTSNYSNFLKISKELSKKKAIQRNKYLSYNESLKAFYNEIKEKTGNGTM